MKKSYSPEGVFLIIGTIFGLLFAVFIPYGAGFDEEQHVVRIFDIAAWNFLPNRNESSGKTYAYADFIRLSYQRRYFQTPAFDQFEPDYFLKPLDKNQTVGIVTRSIYSPVNFIPQAVVARYFWRKLDFPVIPIAILCRVLGVITYLAGCYLAIRLLPIGKWVMVTLALAPTALFQASTLNTDGFTNAISFLFIAISSNLFLETSNPLPKRKLAFLILIIILVGMAKPGLFFIFPLLLWLPYKKINSSFFKFTIWFAVFLAIFFALSYNFLALQNSHFTNNEGSNLSRQFAFIVNQPVDFLYAFLWGNLRSIGNYLGEWIAVYGHWAGKVPGLVYILFLVSLFIALGWDNRIPTFSRWQRIGFLLTFIISTGAFALMHAIAIYNPGDLSVFGRQGRYYIPSAPMLFLAIQGLFSLKGFLHNHAQKIILNSLLGTLVFFAIGIYASYYTYCGTSIYSLQGCKQPIYKNIAWTQTPALTLNSKTTVVQQFSSHCIPIDKVQVYLHSYSDTSDSTIMKISIYDSEKRILHTEKIPLQELLTEDFLFISVSNPFLQSIQKEYFFEFRVLGTGSVDLAVNEFDYFREGVLFVQGNPVPQDIVFMYQCKPFWQQIFHPVNSK
ncbi:DUF2142 domain-containing protein [Bellilinea sp.]